MGFFLNKWLKLPVKHPVIMVDLEAPQFKSSPIYPLTQPALAPPSTQHFAMRHASKLILTGNKTLHRKFHVFTEHSSLFSNPGHNWISASTSLSRTSSMTSYSGRFSKFPVAIGNPWVHHPPPLHFNIDGETWKNFDFSSLGFQTWKISSSPLHRGSCDLEHFRVFPQLSSGTLSSTNYHWII